MVAKWAKVPAVWCGPSPGHACTGVTGLNPTGGMSGLVKPLINCIINQLYSSLNLKKKHLKKQNSPLADKFSTDALGEMLLIICNKIEYGYIVDATIQ